MPSDRIVIDVDSYESQINQTYIDMNYYTKENDFQLNNTGIQWINESYRTPVLSNNNSQNNIQLPRKNENTNSDSTLASFFSDGNQDLPFDFGINAPHAEDVVELVHEEGIKRDITVFLTSKGVRLINKEVRCFLLLKLTGTNGEIHHFISINKYHGWINKIIYDLFEAYNDQRMRIGNLYRQASQEMDESVKAIKKRMAELDTELKKIGVEITTKTIAKDNAIKDGRVKFGIVKETKRGRGRGRGKRGN